MTKSNQTSSDFPNLPKPEMLLRLPQIVGNPKSNPPIPAIIPVSAATWWNWVANGRAPKGYKLSPGVTAWKASEVYAFLNSIEG